LKIFRPGQNYQRNFSDKYDKIELEQPGKTAGRPKRRILLHPAGIGYRIKKRAPPQMRGGKLIKEKEKGSVSD
jgi:hypothetical protein